MEIKASAKYIRMSPKKVRLVSGLINGLEIEQALNQLKFVNKRAAKPIKKLLDSAIANAINNFNLEKSNLFIKSIVADEGPTLKRWRPRAFGRATPIRKRSTHISVVLAEKVPSKDAKKKKTEVEAPVKLEDLAKKPVEDKEIKKTKKQASQKLVSSWPKSEEARKDLSPEAQEAKMKEPFDKTRKGKDRGQQHLDQLRQKERKGLFRRIFRRKAN